MINMINITAKSGVLWRVPYIGEMTPEREANFRRMVESLHLDNKAEDFTPIIEESIDPSDPPEIRKMAEERNAKVRIRNSRSELRKMLGR